MARARPSPLPLLAGIGVALAVLALRTATGREAWPGWTDYLYNAIQLAAVAVCGWRAVAIPRERAAWALITAALASFAIGDLYWVAAFADRADEVPYPSIADAFYLAFLPLAYVGVGLLARARAGQISRLQWLDGLIAALGAASIGSAMAYTNIVDATGGAPLTVATNLAYPIGDLVLLGIVAGVAGAFGRAAGATWWILGAGLAIFAVTDTVFLLQAANGTYRPDGLLDAGWLLPPVLFAVAAWRRPAMTTRRIDGLSTLAVPASAGVAFVALVVYDHYDRVPAVSLWLAAAGMLALLVRLSVVFAANQRMLAASERDARTDALTGLDNRRALIEALERAQARGWPNVLVLYDLDGFKAYNDRFGHPAGDVLLQRLAHRLRDAVPPPGSAFRMGGDEFCVLVPPELADLALARADAALREQGEGFHIEGSRGLVRLPDEAATAAKALALVDQRMYAAKSLGRASAVAQTRDVLLAAVEERSPSLGGHVGDVAGLAVRVAQELGLAPEEVEHVRAAAELHDVGKLAIPDAILEKPGPLDEAEWAFMHRHTIVGERILSAAPALAAVAPLVRSSHERWDGTGYPDGLAGEAIPLGARIVSLCDAWDAMTTDRPYRRALSPAAALAELERCSGTQFDPAVVRALRAVLTRPAALSAVA